MKFQRIQDMRTDADLSQRELSEILHISQRSYSHYETGSRNIPIEMLIRLANYYDTSIDYLVGRTDVKNRLQEPKKKIPGFDSGIFAFIYVYLPSFLFFSSHWAILLMFALSYSLKI